MCSPSNAVARTQVYVFQSGSEPSISTVDVADPLAVEVSAIPEVNTPAGEGCYASYWVLDEARWTPAVAPADVREGLPCLLVRILDAEYCATFGDQVRLLQAGAASTQKERDQAMKEAVRVRDASAARIGLIHEVWVVIWVEVRTIRFGDTQE